MLGGNQGDVYAHFSQSMRNMQPALGKITKCSKVYVTKAWGPIPQPDYLNMAIELETFLPPAYLLKQLLELEKQFGRKRDVKFGPRTLDIDILLYGRQVIQREGLQVPHPEIQNRRFVLVPCCDIIPGVQHPVLKTSMRGLLRICKDALEVNVWKG